MSSENKKRDKLIITFFFIVPFIFYFIFFISKGFWAPGDGKVFYVPPRSFIAENLKNLHLPLWNSYINLGYPSHADIQNSIFYLPNLIFYTFLPFEFAYNYMFLFHLSLAGVFTYLYLNQIKLNWKASFLGGLVFMFSGTLNAKLGHVTVLNSIVWLPIILYFYEKLLTTRKKKYIFFMSAAFSMQVFAGFIQISFYTAIILLVYFIFSIKKYDSFRRWVYEKINFSIITLGLTAVQTVPLIILTKSAGRTEITYEYFSSFSLDFISLITLIFPNILGVHIPNSPYKLYDTFYFGPGNLTEFALYIGILPLIFAIVSVFKERKDFHVKIWSTIAFISLILALGASIPIINKIMYLVPGYNYFRVSARFLFGFSFGMTFLFAKQIDKLIKNRKEAMNIYTLLIRITGILIGCSIICIMVIQKIFQVILSATPALSSTELFKSRTFGEFADIFSLRNPAILIPLGIMVMYLIFLIIVQRYRNIGNRLVFFSLAFLIVIDLHTFDFYHEKVVFNYSSESEISALLKSHIQNGERLWPVINNENDFEQIDFSPNKNIMDNIHTINGYATFLTKEYRSLTQFDERGVNDNSDNLLINSSLLSSLNAKYIIVSNVYNSLINTINKTDILEVKAVYTDNNITVPPSSQAGSMSVIQNPVTIEPDMIYKISVDLEEASKTPVFIDLWGEGYDNNEQQMTVPLGVDKKYTKFIYSGLAVPQNVFFRVFSDNQTKIDIDQVKLEKIGNREYPKVTFKKLLTEEGYTLYENMNVLPKMYSILNVNESNGEYSRIFDMDLSKSGLVEGIRSSTFSLAIIENIKYTDGFASATVSSDEKSFIVFSESFFPGWNAYVDGEKREVLKVNGLIQGLQIPAGKHEVEFKYEPNSLNLGLLILLLTILYSILFVNFKSFQNLLKRFSRR
ncbi:YfhO family protein [Paenibacillus sp. Marseille-P2973]|uniref:YfhO family protein n=1 Tax=Paenibacillus sp. Marseille-P2973 TaxID=1871032 RepID=UPI001B36B2DB|nr:YfhO family protein [Paenibacillus sp. Marseille-P2973]MBQ4899955.1 YfhO family protein [Paenibacillus sp. Marseille-P2973]